MKEKGSDIESTQEAIFLGFEEMDVKSQLADDLRIEEKIGFSWSGVSGCHHTDTANAQAMKALKKWASEKDLAARSHAIDQLWPRRRRISDHPL